MFDSFLHLPLGTSPRYLFIWRWIPSHQIIKDFTCNETIENCKWNSEYFVFITQTQLFLYSMKKLNLIAAMQHFPNNLSFALSIAPNFPYLFYTTPTEVGNISFYDIKQGRLMNKFQAHQSTITNIALDNKCTLLATSSETGTIVRVFQIPTGEILYSFRIHNFPIQITTLSFCDKSNYLLCISSNSRATICLVNEKLKYENIFYHFLNNYENTKGINTIEEDDGFMTITTSDKEPNEKSISHTDLASLPRYSSGNQDDMVSVATNSHKSYFTSDKRDYERPNSDEKNKANAGAGVGNLISGYTTTVFNLFTRKNAQQLVDMTMDGLQKARAYSHDLFNEAGENGNPSEQNDNNNAGHKPSLPSKIDKKVVRPLFQVKIPKNLVNPRGILKYVEVQSSIQPQEPDHPFLEGGDLHYNYQPEQSATMFRHSGDDNEDTPYDPMVEDDRMSELTDQVGYEENYTLKTKLAHVVKKKPNNPAPDVQFQTTITEELKLLLLSQDGIFQR